MKFIFTFLATFSVFFLTACSPMPSENSSDSEVTLPLSGYINWRGVVLSLPTDWAVVEVSYEKMVLENTEGHQISFLEDCSEYDDDPYQTQLSIGDFTYFGIGADPYSAQGGESYSLMGNEFQDQFGCPLGIFVDPTLTAESLKALLETRFKDQITWYEFQLEPPHKMNWVIEGGIAGMGPLYFKLGQENGLINGYNAGCMVDPEDAKEGVIRLDFWIAETPPPPQEIKPGYMSIDSTMTLNGHEIQVTEIKADEVLGEIPYDEASHRVLYYLPISQTRWLRIFTTEPYREETEKLLEQFVNQLP